MWPMHEKKMSVMHVALFSYAVFKLQYAFYMDSPSQCAPVAFQVFISHAWLSVTLLGVTGLEEIC